MTDIIKIIDEALVESWLPIDIKETSASRYIIDRYYGTSHQDLIDDDALISIIQEVFYAADKYDFNVMGSMHDLKFRIIAGPSKVDFWPADGKFEVHIPELSLTDTNYQQMLQSVVNLYKFLVEIPGQ